MIDQSNVANVPSLCNETRLLPIAKNAVIPAPNCLNMLTIWTVWQLDQYFHDTVVTALLAAYTCSLPPTLRELLHRCLQGSLLVKLELMAFRVQPASLSSIYKETTSTSWDFLYTSLLLFCLTSSARSACEFCIWLKSVEEQMLSGCLRRPQQL